MSTIRTPIYVARAAVHRPSYVVEAKKRLRKAFEYQAEGRCYSLVEFLSTCPTNWGKTPIEAVQWLEEVMLPYYPLGEFSTPDNAA